LKYKIKIKDIKDKYGFYDQYEKIKEACNFKLENEFYANMINGCSFDVLEKLNCVFEKLKDDTAFKQVNPMEQIDNNEGGTYIDVAKQLGSL
jgi:hypothetical protein